MWFVLGALSPFVIAGWVLWRARPGRRPALALMALGALWSAGVALVALDSLPPGWALQALAFAASLAWLAVLLGRWTTRQAEVARLRKIAEVRADRVSMLSHEVRTPLAMIKGAADLSLRAIARELGITAPAIYNYFPRRDDLVTVLIVDAFSSFGDSQLAARDAVSSEELAGRLFAIGVAYRQWAIAYPQRYQLIFGTPIPGYEAPLEQVLPAGARALTALVSVIEALRMAGRLRVDEFPQIMPGHEAMVEMWKKYGGQVDDLSLSVAMLIWARVHGLVSLEIAGNLPPFGPNADALYLYELASIGRQFIKE